MSDSANMSCASCTPQTYVPPEPPSNPDQDLIPTPGYCNPDGGTSPSMSLGSGDNCGS